MKGRTETAGAHLFAGRHVGHVEGWMKWSYSEMPPAYRHLFEKGNSAGLATATISKTRALRKVRLNSITAVAEEVNANMDVDHGINVELTRIEIAGRKYFSLAFEAYPTDSAMRNVFHDIADAFLRELPNCGLTADNSKSYPEFLRDLSGLT